MQVKMIERQRQLAGSDPKDDGLDERYNYFIEFGKKERWTTREVLSLEQLAEASRGPQLLASKTMPTGYFLNVARLARWLALPSIKLSAMIHQAARIAADSSQLSIPFHPLLYPFCALVRNLRQ